MGRRPAVALVVSLMAFTPLAVATPADAARPVVTAQGHVACGMGGKVKYSPRLTAAERSVSASFTGTLSCTVGTTGDSRVTVLSGKLKGSSPAYGGGCLSPHPTFVNLSIKWKADWGKVESTSVAFSAVEDGTSRTARYRAEPSSVHTRARGRRWCSRRRGVGARA